MSPVLFCVVSPDGAIVVQNKHSGENSMLDCERLRRGCRLWTRGFADNTEAAKMTSLQGI